MIYSKSGSWAAFSAHSSGPTNVTRNGEAAVRSSLVPAPNFVIGFKSAGSPSFDVTDPARSSVAVSQQRSAAPEARTASESPHQLSAREDGLGSASGSNNIELAIDSLPRFNLVKPIPVIVTPLGDRL